MVGLSWAFLCLVIQVVTAREACPALSFLSGSRKTLLWEAIMPKIIGWFLLSLVLAGCASSTPAVSPSAPAPTVTPSASADSATVDAHCPLDPTQTDLTERLPRQYYEDHCLLSFLPGADATWPAAILAYPSGWRVALANPSGTALLFELAGRVFFVQFYRSDLPLERADEVSAVTEGLEEPAVHPEEVVKERSLLEIGGKPVLILTTALSDQSIRRYFLREVVEGKATSIVMFQITVAAPDLDNTPLLPVIERMIEELELRQ
jgi:hypothetical protein